MTDRYWTAFGCPVGSRGWRTSCCDRPPPATQTLERRGESWRVPLLRPQSSVPLSSLQWPLSPLSYWYQARWTCRRIATPLPETQLNYSWQPILLSCPLGTQYRPIHSCPLGTQYRPIQQYHDENQTCSIYTSRL